MGGADEVFGVVVLGEAVGAVGFDGAGGGDEEGCQADAVWGVGDGGSVLSGVNRVQVWGWSWVVVRAP